MIDEHALAIHNNISLDDLDYLVKKANRLGLSGREISGVREDVEDTTTHLYFQTQGLEHGRSKVHAMQYMRKSCAA